MFGDVSHRKPHEHSNHPYIKHKPDTFRLFTQTYNLGSRRSSAVIMSETMHQSHCAVLARSINTALCEGTRWCWSHPQCLFFLLHQDAVQPAALSPHYRVVHFDVSGVDLTNSTLVKAEFRIFRAPNPQARASEQRVEIYQVCPSSSERDGLISS